MDRAPIRAKILVVDDEPQISEYESALLAELGHEVLTAGNGAEAVRVAREQQPDLLLLDIMMPEMSGIEVCQQLRADPARATFASLSSPDWTRNGHWRRAL